MAVPALGKRQLGGAVVVVAVGGGYYTGTTDQTIVERWNGKAWEG